MGRIFLSHSSKDKNEYVNIIARKLVKRFGVSNIVYDSMTFEDGKISLDEIEKGVLMSDLFVLFISDNSLDSDFVRYEIKEAKQQSLLRERLTVLPIIIDQNIDIYDKRIPSWLREKVIKYRSKPTVIVKKIVSKYTELIALSNLETFEKKNLFVGRHSELDAFETEITESLIFGEEPPRCFFACGPNGIGRRSLLKKALVETNLLDKFDDFFKITLDSESSIENFILQIFEICKSGKTAAMHNLIERDVNEKIQYAISLLAELSDDGMIMIVDDGCIVNHQGEIVSWFKEIILDRQFSGKSIFAIVSTKRIMDYEFSDNIIKINVQELLPKDRKKLLISLCDYENIQLSGEETQNYLSLLNGFPMQVYFAVGVIKDNGPTNGLLTKAADIAEYTTQKAELMLQDYLSYQDFINSKEIQIIRVLVEFSGSVSYSTIYDIIGYSDENYRILNEFYIKGIIEKSIQDPEYLRVNTSIQVYISRMRLDVTPEYYSNLSLILDEFLNDFSFENHDVVDSMVLISEALYLEKSIPKELLIPSYYLKTVVNMYNVKRSYSKVIKFVDVVLEYEKNIDSNIVYSLRYYLCRALIKRKLSNRFFNEVKKLTIEDRNLLKGMFFRSTNSNERAIEMLTKCLGNRKNANIAKRELVHAYLNLEKFSEARSYANEFFSTNKQNPHLALNYFKSVYGDEVNESNGVVIEDILDTLNNMKHTIAEEFYLRCKGLYYSKYKRDRFNAIKSLDKAIEIADFKAYALIDKFTVADNLGLVTEMECILEDIEITTKKSEWADYNAILMQMNATMLTHKGCHKDALKLVNDFSRDNRGFNQDRFVNKLTRINERHCH